MFKKQFYDIHASFLVPVYNMSPDILTQYITRQEGRLQNGSIYIDVWLINANQSAPLQSMLKSLQTEEKNYQTELDKTLAEEKPVNDAAKSPKVRKLEHNKKIFSDLINQANDSVFHKKPDAEFMKIAERNLGHGIFAELKPDLKNYLYLAALSRYEER